MIPGQILHTITDAHVYVDHVDRYNRVKGSISTYAPPQLDLSGLSGKSMLNLTYEDGQHFKLINYQHGDAVKYNVAV